MPRHKLSEFRAKKIIFSALGINYDGRSVYLNSLDSLDLEKLSEDFKYVVKVDQGVKGRFKKGLVALDVEAGDVPGKIEGMHSMGYTSFLVEKQVSHQQSQERYLSIAYNKHKKLLSYSENGGIDIESSAETIREFSLDENIDWTDVSKTTGLPENWLRSMVDVFENNFITLMEINPYVVAKDGISILDLAIEVDDAGSYFVKTWSEQDFRSSSSRRLTAEEKLVRELDENSPASLKLEVLNPDGSIFLLLSGGGASVVVADEVNNLGLGKQLANYGEYSGNPNTEETFVYTRELLNLLLKSGAPRKVLFIGGAVANFTDIANTFTGIIQAIEELHQDLQKQNVKVFVRRGGPRQEIGLAKIREVLDKYGLLGAVHDPSMPLTDAVAEAVRGIA